MNKKAKAPDFSGLFEENKMVCLDDFCGKYLSLFILDFTKNKIQKKTKPHKKFST